MTTKQLARTAEAALIQYMAAAMLWEGEERTLDAALNILRKAG